MYKPIKEESKGCVVCDSMLFGRSDKRFCSVKCKNHYHAHIRKSTKTVSKETIKELYKNYRILSSMIGRNCQKYEVSKLVLERKGFSFDVVSGMERNNFGYKLKVFNFSWYISHHSKVVIYHNPDENEISPFVYKRFERFGPLG